MTSKRALWTSLWGVQVCDELGLFDALGIDPVAMRNFAVRVEGSYLDCPYHNKRHAAAVTLVLFQIVLHSGIMAGPDQCLIGRVPLKLYILAAVIAAGVHDVRHPGIGSDFRVRTVSAPHSSPTTTIPRLFPSWKDHCSHMCNSWKHPVRVLSGRSEAAPSLTWSG